MYGYELQNSDYYYNTLNENNEIEVNTPCGVISVYWLRVFRHAFL